MPCRITDAPIDITSLLAAAATSSDGAVLLFLGVVRDLNEGREVGHLEYDAYVPMAERLLAEIAQEASRKWDVGTISVIHRVGRLQIGEASVAIAVAAPHRREAYAASRYVIDEIKKRVPIWKREGYLEGESEWLPGNTPEAFAGMGDDE
jgi:molybdopterin synthase catalytic subunit